MSIHILIIHFQMSAKPVPVFSTDNKILSRQITQLNQDLNAATRKIDKLKKDNDDLTSQVCIVYTYV